MRGYLIQRGDFQGETGYIFKMHEQGFKNEYDAKDGSRPNYFK